MQPTKAFQKGTACIDPVLSPCGRVRCRNCTGCREYRLNDYEGRCLAEQLHSDRAVAVTLTYKTNHPHAEFLVYKDVQDFLKRLRSKTHGYKCRYIVAGEYGSRKGRTHWHIIIFLKGRTDILNAAGQEVAINPHGTDPKDRINEQWPLWPHGHSYFQPADRRGFRYLLKYILKDTRAEPGTSASHFSLSKKPVLGFQYLSNLATSYAINGHLPASSVYDLGRKRYWLASSARDAFLRVYASAYFSHHGHTPRILPQWCRDYIHEQWPNQATMKPAWVGFYNDAGQGVVTHRRVTTSEARPIFGPLRPREEWLLHITRNAQEVTDQDGDKAKTFIRAQQPFDWRDAVGLRRIRYENRIWREQIEQTSPAGVHSTTDSCPCAACEIRRSTAGLARWYQFQTPEGFFPLAHRPKARKPQGPPTYRKAEAVRTPAGASHREARTGPHINRISWPDRLASLASA